MRTNQLADFCGTGIALVGLPSRRRGEGKKDEGGEREREKERKRGRKDVDRTERREGEEEAAASRIQRIGASPH